MGLRRMQLYEVYTALEMVILVAIGVGIAKVLPIALAPIVVGFIACRFLLGVGEAADAWS